MDLKRATTLASVTVMTFMLAGGFFVKVSMHTLFSSPSSSFLSLFNRSEGKHGNLEVKSEFTFFYSELKVQIHWILRQNK